MTDICSLTLTALTGALQNKELSAVEAATACLVPRDALPSSERATFTATV